MTRRLVTRPVTR